MAQVRLITGHPGIHITTHKNNFQKGSGKSTICGKLYNELKSRGILVGGFYTEELRKNSSRVGFNIISFQTNKKEVTAHVDSDSNIRVGKYGVDVKAFESVAIPELTTPNSSKIYIIDEIGKISSFQFITPHTIQRRWNVIHNLSLQQLKI